MHVSMHCLAAAAAAGGHVVLVICMVDSWASSCESVESLCYLFFLVNSNSAAEARIPLHRLAFNALWHCR